MMPLKLSVVQEREVALGYLCGMEREFLQRKYGVCDATIRNNIVSGRSLEWNDPLVELYRQTNCQKREKNSAHLWLSFVLEEGVAPAGVVDRQKDQQIYWLVEGEVYVPLIRRIISDTSLDRYTLARGPYDRFMEALSGNYDRCSNFIARNIFVAGLKDRFDFEADNLSLEEVVKETEAIIIAKIKDGGLGWSRLKKELVHDVLERLDELQRRIIGIRYGLEGYDGPKVLKEMEPIIGYSREEIRQLELKGMRNLRLPIHYEKLRPLTGLATDEDLASSLRESYSREIRLSMLKEEISAEFRRRREQLSNGYGGREGLADEAGAVLDELLSRSIEELNLGARATNCLLNHNVNTVRELVEQSDKDLMKFKHFGRKCLNDVKSALAQQGLTLTEK